MEPRVLNPPLRLERQRRVPSQPGPTAQECVTKPRTPPRSRAESPAHARRAARIARAFSPPLISAAFRSPWADGPGWYGARRWRSGTGLGSGEASVFREVRTSIGNRPVSSHFTRPKRTASGIEIFPRNKPSASSLPAPSMTGRDFGVVTPSVWKTLAKP